MFEQWLPFLAIASGVLLLLVVSMAVVVFMLGKTVKKLSGRLMFLDVEVRQLREQLQAEDWSDNTVAPQRHPVKHGDVHEAAVRSPYALAIELAHQGYGAETLASQCGISRGEADLIISLYKSNAG
ncbi:DUF2802 domain-containing protein [Leeia oryzae]|uniref:DUF2802 domain-containing protein n=1 Tax=Leeia oryzae TaxID=356662 RepID=UPI000369AD13|nr:DUF2802 domain-containing protein [Leeia oryzae]